MSGKYRKKKTFQTILSKCLSQKYSMRSMPSSLKVNLYKKILAYITQANFIFTLYNFKPLPQLLPFQLRFALTTHRLIPKITQVRQVLIFSSRSVSTYFETNRYRPVGFSPLALPRLQFQSHRYLLKLFILRWSYSIGASQKNDGQIIREIK